MVPSPAKHPGTAAGTSTRRCRRGPATNPTRRATSAHSPQASSQRLWVLSQPTERVTRKAGRPPLWTDQNRPTGPFTAAARPADVVASAFAPGGSARTVVTSWTAVASRGAGGGVVSTRVATTDAASAPAPAPVGTDALPFVPPFAPGGGFVRSATTVLPVGTPSSPSPMTFCGPPTVRTYVAIAGVRAPSPPVVSTDSRTTVPVTRRTGPCRRGDDEGPDGVAVAVAVAGAGAGGARRAGAAGVARTASGGVRPVTAAVTRGAGCCPAAAGAAGGEAQPPAATSVASTAGTARAPPRRAYRGPRGSRPPGGVRGMRLPGDG